MRKNREQTEWIEIVEPKTRERMYANLVTGECSWEAPLNVPKTHTRKPVTIWQKPSNCDIIPLAKLQLLKKNTEGPSHDSLPSNFSSQHHFAISTTILTPVPNHNDNHYTNFCNDLRSNLTQDTSSISQPPSHNNNHHWKAHHQMEEARPWNCLGIASLPPVPAAVATPKCATRNSFIGRISQKFFHHDPCVWGEKTRAHRSPT
uniref:WW domain-containing protein n=1 Tax=Ditylenchus dipsaci TaxID=166011 RepID=A0A915DPD4_9BILA